MTNFNFFKLYSQVTQFFLKRHPMIGPSFNWHKAMMSSPKPHLCLLFCSFGTNRKTRPIQRKYNKVRKHDIRKSSSVEHGDRIKNRILDNHHGQCAWYNSFIGKPMVSELVRSTEPFDLISFVYRTPLISKKRMKKIRN